MIPLHSVSLLMSVLLLLTVSTPKGENAGTVAAQDHVTWYRKMFVLSVTNGILHLVIWRVSVMIRFIFAAQNMYHRIVKPFGICCQHWLSFWKVEKEASLRVVSGHFSICLHSSLYGCFGRSECLVKYCTVYQLYCEFAGS
jgi:hypothetical protein